MTTYTTRRQSYEGPQHRARQTLSQRGVVPAEGEDPQDLPFPNKPVFHRRTFRAQAQLHPSDFKKMTISSQPEAHSLCQEDHPTGTSGRAGPQRSETDSHRVAGGELQSDRAIKAKQLLLQEKLLKVTETIRRESADPATHKDLRSGSGRQQGGRVQRGEPQTKSRIPELQRTEAVRSRPVVRGDVRELHQKQDHKTDTYRRKNTRDTQQARHKVTETPQSKPREAKSSHRKEPEACKEPNKVRWQNAKEHARRRGNENQIHDIWEKTSKKGFSEIKTSEQESRGRVQTVRRSPGHEPNLPQRGQQQGPYGDAARRRCNKSTPPLASTASHYGGGQQEQVTDGLRPCKICHRKFVEERWERHVQICKKVKQASHPVYNSYKHRIKGTPSEEFYRTHARSETPEVLKREFEMRKKKHLQRIALAADISQPKYI